MDDGALKFAEAFYTALLAGDCVSDAVRQARLAARSQGDPTWLAYTVFAHPHAVVKLGDEGAQGS
jgi:hypothetical protein